jgi:ABC-2 type transport system ATP-binding protein
MGIILKVENISKKFDQKLVLDSISFQLKEGSIACFIGPDGSGKTTLFRILIGALLTDDGKIFYKNKQIKSEKELEKIKLNIGYIPQYYGLYTDLTVYENLEYFGKLYLMSDKHLKNRIKELLQFVRLERFYDRKAGALSGGMYKKLAVAVSLLHNPDILIMDEPTNGVDPVSRRELWELFFLLKSQNKTILIATPYMDEAERCDEILLLYNGKILFKGELELFYQNFSINVINIEIENYYYAYEYLKANLKNDFFIYLSGRKIRILYEEKNQYKQIMKILNHKFNNYIIKKSKLNFEDLFIHCIKVYTK